MSLMQKYMQKVMFIMDHKHKLFVKYRPVHHLTEQHGKKVLMDKYFIALTYPIQNIMAVATI